MNTFSYPLYTNYIALARAVIIKFLRRIGSGLGLEKLGWGILVVMYTRCTPPTDAVTGVFCDLYRPIEY